MRRSAVVSSLRRTACRLCRLRAQGCHTDMQLPDSVWAWARWGACVRRGRIAARRAVCLCFAGRRRVWSLAADDCLCSWFARSIAAGTSLRGLRRRRAWNGSGCSIRAGWQIREALPIYYQIVNKFNNITINLL